RRAPCDRADRRAAAGQKGEEPVSRVAYLVAGEVEEYVFEVGLLLEDRLRESTGQQVVDQLPRRIERNDVPLVHDRDPVAQDLGLVEIVGRQKDRGAAALNASDQLPEI